MPKSVVISTHARQRAAERLNMSRRDEIVHQFRQAYMYGISPSTFNGEFKNYLIRKQQKNKSCTIKVFCDFIYVMRNKKLITMFKVPDKYLPIKKYLSSGVQDILEIETPAELKLRKLYKKSRFNFYIKEIKQHKNWYTVALVLDNSLAAVSTGKGLDKQKMSCVKQYFNENSIDI